MKKSQTMVVVMAFLALGAAVYIGVISVQLDPLPAPLQQLRENGTQEYITNMGGRVVCNGCNGGKIYLYEAAAEYMIKKGMTLEIKGQAISAGTILADMMAAKGLLCLQPGAALFYHEGQELDAKGKVLGPYDVRRHYRPEIVKIVDTMGGWPSTKSGLFTKLTTRDVQDLYPLCGASK